MERSVGQGVYAVGEASRLTGVDPARVRRWFAGYAFPRASGRRVMPPVIHAHDRRVDGQLQLTFLDLIEIRLIDAFRRAGVPWAELRRAADVGSRIFQTEHPFASRQFRTDGRRMFAETAGDAAGALTIQTRDFQQVFPGVIEKSLVSVDYDETIAVRWWPLGKQHRVVVDPRRSFGRPVGAASGVPAAILAAYARHHGDVAASRWYDVDRREVRDCSAMADRLAA